MSFLSRVFTAVVFALLSISVSAQSLADEKARAERKAQVQNQMRLDNEQNERNLQVTLNAYAYRIKCGTLDGGHFAFFKGVVYQDAFAMNGSTPSYSARARYKVSNGVLTFVDGGYYEFHFASSTLYRKVTTTVYDGVCEVLSANSGNL